MRTHRKYSLMLAMAMAALGGGALAQTSGSGSQGAPQGAQGAQRTPTPAPPQTPASQTNPPASQSPTPASQPNPTPASTPAPTPASHATPTPTSPPPLTNQNGQTRLPSARQNAGTGNAQQTPLARCAALTGIPRAECERRDAPAATDDLPAGVTPARRQRQAQREADAARDNTVPRTNSADTMRAPPTATPSTSTTTPASSAPAPASTPRENADSLNRPRE